MSKASIKFDLKALKKIEDRLVGAVDSDTLGKIGDGVYIEMLSDVTKGISPIKGKGRFPAYKWAGKANDILKRARNIKDKQRRKELRQDAAETKANKYPFTAEAKRLGKKPRPVNLKLSGDFLDSLTWWIVGKGRDAAVKIGFRERLSVLKEQGHREGVNGQPERPMIPVDPETLTPKYALLIRKILAQTLRIKLR